MSELKHRSIGDVAEIWLDKQARQFSSAALGPRKPGGRGHHCLESSRHAQKSDVHPEIWRKQARAAVNYGLSLADSRPRWCRGLQIESLLHILLASPTMRLKQRFAFKDRENCVTLAGSSCADILSNHRRFGLNSERMMPSKWE